MLKRIWKPRFLSTINQKPSVNQEEIRDSIHEGWLSKLPNRCIISVRGKDTTGFLQQLTSQDMRLFEREKDRAALYTCFLNPKGRVQHDAIIAKPLLANQEGDETEYWVDIDEVQRDEFFKHLKVGLSLDNL